MGRKYSFKSFSALLYAQSLPIKYAQSLPIKQWTACTVDQILAEEVRLYLDAEVQSYLYPFSRFALPFELVATVLVILRYKSRPSHIYLCVSQFIVSTIHAYVMM